MPTNVKNGRWGFFILKFFSFLPKSIIPYMDGYCTLYSNISAVMFIVCKS